MELNTILILIVLGILVGILFALRRMFSLERKIAKVELMLAPKKRAPARKVKRMR